MISEDLLRRELQAAMKARDMPTVYVLRGLLAAAGNLRIDKGGVPLGEAELLALVQRESKKREEAATFARDAGRAEIVAQNEAEQVILARYLPQALGDAELTRLLETWIAEGGQNLGSLMGRLKAEYAGRYDGKRASELARTLLGAR